MFTREYSISLGIFVLAFLVILLLWRMRRAGAETVPPWKRRMFGCGIVLIATLAIGAIAALVVSYLNSEPYADPRRSNLPQVQDLLRKRSALVRVNSAPKPDPQEVQATIEAAEQALKECENEDLWNGLSKGETNGLRFLMWETRGRIEQFRESLPSTGADNDVRGSGTLDNVIQDQR